MAASNLQQILNFTNPGNFTFDPNLIVVDGAGARLKLQEGQETFAQNFNSDAGFTYNSSLAEFASGLVRQIDKTPTGSLLGATYTSSVNASWSKSSIPTTAALVGTPSIVSNRLQCFGANGVRYEHSSIGALTAGALKFKYRPNYSTAPASNVNLVALTPTSGVSGRVVLTHSPSGNTLRVTVNDSVGSTILNVQAIGSAWEPTAGVTYEFELNFDSAAGVVRVFIDGVLHGTLSPGAWTKGSTAVRLAIGAAQTIYTLANAEFEDVLLFSSVQHTSGYTPGYSVNETIYLESKIDLPVFSFGGVGSIVSVDSATVIESNGPRYIVAGRFWNGTSWVVSDGSFSQASPSGDVIANLPDFPATGATLVPVSVVFGDSNGQQSVDDFSVTVTGTIDYPSEASILANASVEADAFETFSEDDASRPGSDDIRYIIRVNSQDKYWDGSAWVDSDGTYAQSNSASVFAANASSLDISEGASIALKAVLHSDNNLTTPELTTATIGYNFFNTQAPPPTCTVWGFYRDVSGRPVEGATVTFSLVRLPKQYREAGDSIIEKKVSVLTSAQGRFEVDLIRSSEFQNAPVSVYEISIEKTDDGLNTSVLDASATKITFNVPDSPDVNVTDLIAPVP